MNGLVRRRTALLALAALLALTPAAWSLEIEDLIARATEGDLELRLLSQSRRIAELRIAQSAAGRGWRLAVGPLDSGLEVSSDLGAAPAVSFGIDPAVFLTAPDPAGTSVWLGVPLSLDIPGTFTPSLSAGVTQPLAGFIGAKADKRVRDLGQTISLFQIDALVASRIAAVARGVISSLKELIELRLAARDLSERLLDIAEEAARIKALDPDADRGTAYKQIEQTRAGVEESLRRSEREYQVRKARLEKDLGVTLEDAVEEAIPGVPDSALDLPSEADVELAPSVRSAGLELALAEARLERHGLERLPSLSVGASAGLSPASGGGVSVPLSVSFKVSWQALDSGLKDLTRQELEAQVELKRLTLERAKQDYASSLADLGLEAMSLENTTADALRNIEAAGVSLDETRVLVEKGMKTERDLAKAQLAVEKRAIQLRLVALDRLAFRYKAKALVLPL